MTFQNLSISYLSKYFFLCWEWKMFKSEKVTNHYVHKWLKSLFSESVNKTWHGLIQSSKYLLMLSKYWYHPMSSSNSDKSEEQEWSLFLSEHPSYPIEIISYQVPSETGSTLLVCSKFLYVYLVRIPLCQLFSFFIIIFFYWAPIFSFATKSPYMGYFNAKTSASVEECVILKYILYCVSVKGHFSPLRSLCWYYSIYLQGAGTLMKWTWQSFRDLDSHLMCPSESHLVCLELWTYRVEFVKQIKKKGSEIRIVDIFLAELEFLMLVSMTYIEVISSH